MILSTHHESYKRNDKALYFHSGGWSELYVKHTIGRCGMDKKNTEQLVPWPPSSDREDEPAALCGQTSHGFGYYFCFVYCLFVSSRHFNKGL